MKKGFFFSFFFLCLFVSCASLKAVNDEQKKETSTLPPDVASNKYSKKRS